MNSLQQHSVRHKKIFLRVNVEKNWISLHYPKRPYEQNNFLFFIFKNIFWVLSLFKTTILIYLQCNVLYVGGPLSAAVELLELLLRAATHL